MFSLLCIDKRSVLLKWILYCKGQELHVLSDWSTSSCRYEDKVVTTKFILQYVSEFTYSRDVLDF